MSALKPNEVEDYFKIWSHLRGSNALQDVLAAARNVAADRVEKNIGHSRLAESCFLKADAGMLSTFIFYII
jgi:hypothetical protein